MKTLASPNQPIGSLTVAELEALITETVRRVLREEIHGTIPNNGEAISEEFFATFGTWEDDRPADEIVAEIYTNRTVSTVDIDL
ncbi:MAG TPA: hypothetical protein VJG32_15555 [Anaerolineae bacterium]|nr:hypothetical protein [Anaerolineae bacterium]